MAWHYFTEDREKIGPIESNVLKQLTRQGIITPETFIEDPTGRTGLAKDVKGLKFPEATQPEPELSFAPSPFTGTPPTSIPVPPVVANSLGKIFASGNWKEKLNALVAWANQFLHPAIPPFADNVFGTILKTGNGKGNPAIKLWWVMWIISSVGSGATLGAIVGNTIDGPVVGLFAGISIAMLTSVLLLMYATIYHRSIASTHIYITENGIAGKGVGKGFLWGDPRLFGFRLAYNQITSVDVAGSTIIIHASGTQYKCYVADPAEIQRVIIEQQQKRT